MRYIATNEVIDKLNTYGMNEYDVVQEFNGRVKANSDEGSIGDLVINWKNEDIVIIPVGLKTALLFVYGQEIKGSYEDLSMIEFKNNIWKLKET